MSLLFVSTFIISAFGGRNPRNWGYGRGGHRHNSNECTSDETVTINGTIYADNWFKFWFNGQFIIEDPIIFIPHQAVQVSFEAPVCGQYSFAIQAQDYSDDITGKQIYFSALIYRSSKNEHIPSANTIISQSVFCQIFRFGI